MFEVIERWKKECLEQDGSFFFDDKKLWTAKNFQELGKFYSCHLIYEPQNDSSNPGETQYFLKLKKQFRSAPRDAKLLMAELDWLMKFPNTSNCDHARQEQAMRNKRERAAAILDWAWNGCVVGAVQERLDYSYSVFSRGLANLSRNQSNHWREMVCAIEFFLSFKQAKPADREALLDDSERLVKFCDEAMLAVGHKHSRNLGIAQKPNPVFRKLIAYMLFPDEKERVFVHGKRKKILTKFCGSASNIPTKQDEALAKLRENLQERHDPEKIDWFETKAICEHWDSDWWEQNRAGKDMGGPPEYELPPWPPVTPTKDARALKKPK